MSEHLLAPDAVVETISEEDEYVWVCEYKEGCEHEPSWIGLFKCTCLIAFCEEHKEGYEKLIDQIAARNKNRVALDCNPHGRTVAMRYQAVHWSHF